MIQAWSPERPKLKNAETRQTYSTGKRNSKGPHLSEIKQRISQGKNQFGRKGNRGKLARIQYGQLR